MAVRNTSLLITTLLAITSTATFAQDQDLINEEKPAGNFEVEFNATALSSGIYYYKLVAGDFVDVKKMILLK